MLRRVPITPALAAHQHAAIATLKYGRATKTLLQFSKRFWRAKGRPRAFGSPAAVRRDLGRQRGTGRGQRASSRCSPEASASDETQAMVARDGIARFADGLVVARRRGPPSSARRARSSGNRIRFARGGYAYFDPSFDPALREWLARPAGRLFFAGEHTSIRWQGYMNGAVESGRRAAAEIAATARLGHGLG